jgi:hypothetical protein
VLGISTDSEGSRFESPERASLARHAQRFLPEYKHAKVDDGEMEQQNDQPAPELPESQRNLTLTLIEAAAAYKAVDKVLDVAVPDAYEGIKHAAKAGMEQIRGSKVDPPSGQDSAE